MSKGDQAAALLERTRVGAVLRRRPPWHGVLILNHHRVGDGTRWETGRDVWSGTAAQLDEQLTFLARHFDLIGPHDLDAALADPRGRAVAITFDDGYRECYDVAFPILRSHGASALFFLTTGFLDGLRGAWWDEVTWMVSRSDRTRLGADAWLPSPLDIAEPSRATSTAELVARYKTLPGDRAEAFLDHLGEVTGSGRRDPAETRDAWLTWDMVREMQAAGMAMGGHTVNHPVLARHDAEVQRAEIAGSAGRIAAETGTAPRSLSYPDGVRGSFDETTKALLADCGLRYGFSNYGGVARAGRTDARDVPRISLGHSMTRERFRAIATLPLQMHYH
jgi:peptidoglycan/xylan/chitin deacetylase (PgdA/CDA1 family)